MHRNCSHCQHRFRSRDLARDESLKMELERRASGLDGLRFLYCRCPACQADTIFVDILSREGEHAEEFEARQADMEAVARRLSHERVRAVVVPIRER